jgi:hypothetical protein
MARGETNRRAEVFQILINGYFPARARQKHSCYLPNWHYCVIVIRRCPLQLAATRNGTQAPKLTPRAI